MAGGDQQPIEPHRPSLGVFEHIHKHISDDARKDSIELGPAHARIKVYIDMTNKEAAEVLMLEAIHLSQKAAAELRTAGLLKSEAKQ
jgi:hypothetical protein